MNKEEEIIQRLDDYQNEYIEILLDIINNNTDKHKEGKEYIYWWERIKKLQQNIIIYTFMKRELQMDKVKEQLDQAFTPHIKSLLDKKVVKELEKDE